MRTEAEARSGCFYQRCRVGIRRRHIPQGILPARRSVSQSRSRSPDLTSRGRGSLSLSCLRNAAARVVSGMYTSSSEPALALQASWTALRRRCSVDHSRFSGLGRVGTYHSAFVAIASDHRHRAPAIGHREPRRARCKIQQWGRTSRLLLLLLNFRPSCVLCPLQLVPAAHRISGPSTDTAAGPGWLTRPIPAEPSSRSHVAARPGVPRPYIHRALWYQVYRALQVCAHLFSLTTPCCNANGSRSHNGRVPLPGAYTPSPRPGAAETCGCSLSPLQIRLRSLPHAACRAHRARVCACLSLVQFLYPWAALTHPGPPFSSARMCHSCSPPNRREARRGQSRRDLPHCPRRVFSRSSEAEGL